MNNEPEFVPGNIGTTHPECMLTIVGSRSGVASPIVTITHDGTVTVNPDYTMDDAARAFWDAVKGTTCPRCGYVRGDAP